MRDAIVEQLDACVDSCLNLWVDNELLQKLVVIGSMGLAYAGVLGFLSMLNSFFSV